MSNRAWMFGQNSPDPDSVLLLFDNETDYYTGRCYLCGRTGVCGDTEAICNDCYHAEFSDTYDD